MKNSSKGKFLVIGADITATITLLTIAILTTLTFLITGCDEGMNMAEEVVGPKAEPDKPMKPEKPTTTGEMKQPEETAGEKADDPEEQPEEPKEAADTIPPKVLEVGWYNDYQLTNPITGDVRLGDTIYTVVVFSEAMQHTVANDETARPALSIVIDGTAKRYRMLPHGVSFESGEAKPLKGGTDDFLCKYTIPADAVGTVALRIEAETADLAGNMVAEVSEYVAPFIVTMPEPAESKRVPLTPPKPIPATEPINEAQRRAEEIVDRIISLHLEANYSAEERNEILEEESGLAYEFITGTLLDIYFEERPEEEGDPVSWYDIVLEYLRLGFTYPDANEEELLEHFRQSVKDGRVTIDISKSVYIKKQYRTSGEERKMLIAGVRVISRRISEREIEVLQQYHLENIPLDLPTELDTIFMEEADISFDFAHNTLLAIHLWENPEDEEVVATGIYRYSRLIFIYLFLRKEFNDEKEEDILNRFRKHSREGNTPIKLGAPLEAL